MASARDARLGVSIGGKYKIVRFLAEGGMGAVYEAFHVVVKRRFAVKFLHADLTQRRDALLRFQREAAAAGALESENIAAVVDFGIAEDGAPYLVMEYLVGCELAGLLRGSGPLPIERATDVVLQACLGIKEAHAAGVIHRDLKPKNLFICRRSDGSDLVKILDFGIAKLQASNAGNAVTGTGGVVGTPSYMSPEQARGSNVIDERTDVYALGVILYQLLSGQTPHPGDSYNAVIYHISTQPALPLVCEGRELPQGLIDIVQRATARDPNDRPASAEELSQELAPFAQRLIWPVLTQDSDRPSPIDAVHAIERSFPGSPVDTSDHPQKPRRVRPAWLVTGSAVLVLLLAGGYLAGRSGESRSKSENSSAQAEKGGNVSAPGVATILANSDDVPANLPSAANVPSATSLQPTPPAVAPERTNPLRTSDFGNETKRPLGTPGRPRGRPAPNGIAAQAPVTSKPADPSGVHAAFDSRNPYE